jgi:hypothetical protein
LHVVVDTDEIRVREAHRCRDRGLDVGREALLRCVIVVVAPRLHVGAGDGDRR